MWNRNENQIILTLIRHGRTKANGEHRYLGKTDEALSAEGRAEIKAYVGRHRYPEADQVFTSSMTRCKETAAIIYPRIAAREIPEWDEMDFGIFEGKNYIELNGNPAYQDWIDSGGTLPFPEGESRAEFLSRCQKGMEKMIRELPEQTKRVTLVVHGGTIMALLSTFYGGGYFDYQVPNGSGFQVILDMRNTEISFEEIKRI